jgi:phospholipid/cholesterol/gamma-HCH transport system permease protein
MNSAFLNAETQPEAMVFSLRDRWVFENVGELEDVSSDVQEMADRHVVFQCGGLEEIDIAGAWVLYDRSQQLTEAGLTSEFKGFKAAHFKFLRHIIDAAAIREYAHDLDVHPPRHPVHQTLESMGAATTGGIEDVGRISRAIFDGIKSPGRLLFNETVRQVYYTGVQAIPIVMVITFLIGIVLAYQGASQLEKFGAKIFVVDMVAIGITREMGALLAAVMVAGRSGSAFAAALGTMKLNEEVDALRVLGLNPNQILILPRILGLLIALPLLTLFANLAGLAGGAMIAIGSFDISALQFWERVGYSTDMNDFFAGMIKTPFFAFLIAAVGTLRGMQVKSSAEELGQKTTQAVVLSIFLIICADAFFTTIFTRIGF